MRVLTFVESVASIWLRIAVSMAVGVGAHGGSRLRCAGWKAVRAGDLCTGLRAKTTGQSRGTSAGVTFVYFSLHGPSVVSYALVGDA